MSQVIPLSTTGTLEHTPASMIDETGKKSATFLIHIPSYAQRDRIGALLFSHGVIPVTAEHGRAVLISEIYEVYEEPDGEGNVAEGKLKGDPDEVAGFLEGYWQRAEVYQELMQRWALQELEIQRDKAQGVKDEDLVINVQPAAPYTPRETARANRIAMELLNYSDTYRQVQSRFGEEEANEAAMLFRIFVHGWDGLKTPCVKDRTGKLTEACVEQLRGELAGKGFPDAYQELVKEIRSQFNIDADTEKNSASPLGQGSSPNGSPASSVELDASVGNSTASNTDPTLNSGSQTTSDTSSSSPSKRGKATKKTGQTAAR